MQLPGAPAITQKFELRAEKALIRPGKANSGHLASRTSCLQSLGQNPSLQGTTPGLGSPSTVMRATGLFRLAVVLLTLGATWYLTRSYFDSYLQSKNLRNVFDLSANDNPPTKPPVTKCGIEKVCPENYFAFRITSGAASVVGPSMCFEDKIIMSSVKNNIGRGLNIALLNGSTGEVIKTGFFDMYSGEVQPLLKFLEKIDPGTLLLLASFDDPASKLTEEARKIFTDMGSSFASKLKFRDNWIFVGGQGLAAKSPYEEHLTNDKETNKYDGWPEVLEMEGCIPRKLA
ncbi:protein FAM3D [Ambystoma mexicanum]|uniref:protein FAM3D n=1 Tax=Ambystoma mexicanum TaxID=8296 RepID=UPI0037E76A83